jgi:carboxyl-terminal processing protease
MSLKVRGLLAVGIGTVLGLSLSLGSVVLADKESPAGLPWEQARLLAEVLEKVQRDYVDKVDDDHLIESAIRGMVADLDPHSSYLDPEEYEEIRISTSGNYSGIGLEVGASEGQIVVVSAIEGSPAAKAGLQSGDVIISIDGMPVDPMDLNDAILRLRGAAGTKVHITLTRDGGQSPVTMDLERTQIQLKSVRYNLVEPSYGYVRVSHFSETTAGDLQDAVEEMARQSGGQLSGVILDLRDNPGGVLDAAVEVTDEFLNDGLIVTADGRVPDARFRLKARPGDIIDGKPLAVIVNGGSASASEIVAGALQDNQRAVIVGLPTFGKGSVQTVMPLSGGRALKLTTSRYFTPSGRSIQNRGIIPDIRTDPVAAAASPEQDYQLSRALELLKTQRVATLRQEP